MTSSLALQGFPSGESSALRRRRPHHPGWADYLGWVGETRPRPSVSVSAERLPDLAADEELLLADSTEELLSHAASSPPASVAALFRKELEQHPHFRGRSGWVIPLFREGTLRLNGQLPSFYLKQVVQAVAHRVPGVSRVINHIEVRDSLGRDSQLETWKVG